MKRINEWFEARPLVMALVLFIAGSVGAFVGSGRGPKSPFEIVGAGVGAVVGGLIGISLRRRLLARGRR